MTVTVSTGYVLKLCNGHLSVELERLLNSDTTVDIDSHESMFDVLNRIAKDYGKRLYISGNVFFISARLQCPNNLHLVY